LENGKASAVEMLKDGDTPDHVPVVKYFTPDGGATWLLTELDPENPDLAFGLCDLGMGFPELGSVLISEIETVPGKLGMKVERDEWFDPKGKTISQYADEARRAESIQA
jgi:hypothetical protein